MRHTAALPLGMVSLLAIGLPGCNKIVDAAVNYNNGMEGHLSADLPAHAYAVGETFPLGFYRIDRSLQAHVCLWPVPYCSDPSHTVEGVTVSCDNDACTVDAAAGTFTPRVAGDALIRVHAKIDGADTSDDWKVHFDVPTSIEVPLTQARLEAPMLPTASRQVTAAVRYQDASGTLQPIAVGDLTIEANAPGGGPASGIKTSVYASDTHAHPERDGSEWVVTIAALGATSATVHTAAAGITRDWKQRVVTPADVVSVELDTISNVVDQTGCPRLPVHPLDDSVGNGCLFEVASHFTLADGSVGLGGAGLVSSSDPAILAVRPPSPSDAAIDPAARESLELEALALGTATISLTFGSATFSHVVKVVSRY